ncbi:glutamine synthetase guanido kinase [Panaeolus papilionaceus]|nr:glutamine synthetase guanido kinase [Panaeolus papilionaceus]
MSLLHVPVEYGPQAATGPDEPNFDQLTIDHLRSQDIKYVRIQWVDLTNIIHFRLIPLPYFAKLLKTSRPGTAIAKVALGLVFLTAADGFSPTGEYLYAIDPSSFRICAYAPGHASVMGWFQEKVPVDLGGRLSLEVDLCPRTVLHRIVEKARREHSVAFLLGFESEFILLKNTSPIEAANPHGWCASAALPTGSVEARAVDEITDKLIESGIEVQVMHSEAAPGQYEVVTGPLEPLQAVDALIHTRETIFNVASKYGLRGTLAPRVYMDSCGTASHTHMSIHSLDSSSDTNHPTPSHSSTPNLTKHEAAFAASLLTHLPDISLLLLPTSASYLRMTDGVWSGGTYVCWGTDNREAPLRLCNAHAPGGPKGGRNFELKTMDGTANPYLAMAAVIGAGMEGIKKGLGLQDLPQEYAGEKAAAFLSEEERKQRGIVDRLPLDLQTARKRFEEGQIARTIFGADFVRRYLDVNKLLNRLLVENKTDAEVTKLLVETY